MILLIDNYDSFTFNVAQSLSALGEEVVVRRNDSLTLADVDKLAPSGIVISPGPGRPEAAGLSTQLIKRFSGLIPILGVCLGHQAIAHVFGGTVIRSSEVVHGKEAIVFHARGDLFRDMPLPFAAGRYHSLCVERASLPHDLEITADTGDGAIMAVRHNSHPTYGVQFHPESVLTPEGEQMFKNFLTICEKFKAAIVEEDAA
ncbi:MAG: aminodeoxychorismate/anthranilate synthase component II [Sphingomonadales bacterium]|nr:aminodeoxychorismate/anthranilate synthase component II [Sphingomonadales bacterium]